MRIDLHSHSSVSDGLDAPAGLVRKMRDAGIEAFALTDHDTLQGLPEARAEAEKLGIELISGAEVSADFQGQDDVHILALFVDEKNDRFNSGLADRQKIRGVQTKVAIRRLVEQRFGRALARRPKQGFDAPIDRWLRGELRNLAGDAIGALDGIVDVRAARRLLDGHTAGASGTGEPLYELLMLSLWRTGLRQPQWTAAS